MQSSEGVDARVVPVAHFAGVTKPAVAKGPGRAPIILWVARLARLGDCPKMPEALLVTRQRTLRSLKQLKWSPESWCENCKGLGACETSWLNLSLWLLFWRRCRSGATICQKIAVLSEKWVTCTGLNLSSEGGRCGKESFKRLWCLLSRWWCLLFWGPVC